MFLWNSLNNFKFFNNNKVQNFTLFSNSPTAIKEENHEQPRNRDKWTAFTLNNDKSSKWWNLISSQKKSLWCAGDLSGSDVLMEVNKNFEEHSPLWHKAMLFLFSRRRLRTLQLISDKLRRGTKYHVCL